MVKKLIGLRLSDEIMQKLEVIAHKSNQTTNYVAKNAIIEWIEIFSRVRQQGMMILGKPLIISLLNFTDAEKLEPLAKLTAERKADLYQWIIGKHLDNDTLDDFIKYTPKILGDTGLMWFDHIEVEKEENSVHFKCSHNLGEKWSTFFIMLLNYLMSKYFNHNLKEETVKHTDNSLFLEYIME